ncbi:MAG TPA: ATP-binding protein, partial [Prolixibacteraceae bacterium]|nr:ATP-binding protein [Prolixibacteraceae bacterium]
EAGYRNFVLNDWEEAVGNARQNKMPVQNREYLLNCKNGDVRTVSVSAYIEEDTCIFLYQDFTDKKHAEVELIKAKEKAEEYDHLKSAFLANMSHEIRTPMNGILGFTRLLREPDLSGEAQQEYIMLIEKSGERMLNIINDIIDISKIESRVMKVNLTETNINNAIEYVYTFFRPETDRKGIKLIYTNSLLNHEAVIMTDREKLYSILTNLLKNAIKFTDMGTIEFGYQINNASPDEIDFFVKDTGIGIPKNRQSAIFERFIQADISDTRALQGAGLGLSISKAYVEMIGGRMWVESTEGKGSSFHFTVPVIHSVPESREVTTDIEKIDQDNQSKILKILIVEDDEISERLIRIGIQKYGKEILAAGTGTEAIEACRNNPDIDLILMDIKLPEINGYEATMRIRQFNTDVIIIAQSAYGLSGDREKALEAGCNDYISKPFAPGIISHLIKKYFPV